MGLVALQAVSRMVFLNAAGRIGQRVLGTAPPAFPPLFVAWTSPFTIATPPGVGEPVDERRRGHQDMLETGFDSLVTAVLTLGGLVIPAGRPDVGWA